MPKTPQNWSPAEYATVAERIALFRAAHPLGRIVTRLHSRDDRQVTFVAAVYRHVNDPRAAATGWATEREGDGDVNAVACLENTETSAIGRALANLGFSASRHRPSREEMERAARLRVAAPVRLVRERPEKAARAGEAPRQTDVDDAHVAEDTQQRAAFDARQQHADAVHDALIAVEAAERAGLPEADVRRHRRVLSARSVPPSEIARIERELRAWLEARFPARDPGHSP